MTYVQSNMAYCTGYAQFQGNNPPWLAGFDFHPFTWNGSISGCRRPIFSIESIPSLDLSPWWWIWRLSAHKIPEWRRDSMVYSMVQYPRFRWSGKKYVVWLVKHQFTRFKVHNIVSHKLYDVCAKNIAYFIHYAHFKGKNPPWPADFDSTPIPYEWTNLYQHRCWTINLPTKSLKATTKNAFFFHFVRGIKVDRNVFEFIVSLSPPI